MPTNERAPAPSPAHRTATRRSDRRLRRRGALVGVVLAVLVVSVLPAQAQGPSNDPAATERAEREKTRTRSGEVHAELDELTASDVELKAEVARLDARIGELDAAAADANAEKDRIEGELADLRRAVEDAEKAVQEARDLAAERAVSAYMKPDRESATQMLAAKDPQMLGRMNTLIRHVAQYDHSVMVDRQMAELQLGANRAELESAQQRIDELKAQAEADLADAEGMRSRQEDVRVQLEARIDALVTESKALDAQEANLASVIAQREVAAMPVTTTSSTAAPTTTAAAPITTVAAPGLPVAPPPTTPRPTTTVPPTSPPVTRPPGGGTLSWPVSGPITSPYGARWGTFHRGIDIGVGMGVPIAAAAAGTVFYSGVMDGYGNVILIDHGNGIVTLYAHQSRLIASNGQYVGRGATIGLVGSTGHSTGPHLHFEVRLGSNGTAVDPMGYLG